jgi:hypothetical protein
MGLRVSDKVFPLMGGDSMPDGKDRLPESKKEEQDQTLTKVMRLAPLLDLIIRLLELALKIFRIIS